MFKTGYKAYGATDRVEKVAELSSLGVILIKFDLADSTIIVNTIDQIIADAGHIDILINNTGFGYFGAFEQANITAAKEQVEVNLFGLAMLVQAIIPYRYAQKAIAY